MRTSSVLALVSLSLLAPGSAVAALPAPPTKIIVPGKSMAGVALGTHWKKARATWGDSRAECVEGFSARYLAGHDCSFEGKGKWPTGAFFGTNARAVKVSAIACRVAYDRRGKNPRFDSPLVKWKTRRGIHLGSSARAVQRAYPRAEREPSESNEDIVYFRLRGKRTMFVVDRARPGARRRVVSISILSRNAR